MKKFFYFLFILFVLVVSGSCKIDFTIPEVSYLFYKTSDAADSMDLKYDVKNPEQYTFQWFLSLFDDGADAIPVDGAVSDTLTVTGFSEKKTVFYYCTATQKGNENKQNSKFYCVFNDGMPSVFIDTLDGKDIMSRNYQPASLILKDGSDELSRDIQIKGRGHISWEEHPKKGYNIKFEDKEKILGMSKAKKWGLLSSYVDDTKLGNWFASRLGRKVFNYNDWQPDLEFADLFVNGEYRGLYQVSELIQINGKRVDIPNIGELTNEYSSENDVNGDGVVNLLDGGFIVEMTGVAEFSSFTTLHGASCSMKDPDLEEKEGSWAPEEIRNYVKQIVNTAERSIFKETEKHYSEYIDVDSFVDWYLLNEFTANKEADFESSVYMYYNPTTEKIVCGPNWDFDKSICQSEGIQVAKERNHWITQLLKDDGFVAAVCDRWKDSGVREELLKSIDKLYEEYDVISVALNVDALKWDSSVTSKNVLKQWMTDRIEFMDEYIDKLWDGMEE